MAPRGAMCEHRDCVVDTKEDFRVCRDCGLVLEQGAISLSCGEDPSPAFAASPTPACRRWMDTTSSHYVLGRDVPAMAAHDIARMGLTARHPENIVAAMLLRCSGKELKRCLERDPPSPLTKRRVQRALTRVQHKKNYLGMQYTSEIQACRRGPLSSGTTAPSTT
jgi:hypothetical protein